MDKKFFTGILFAILAAALYAVSTPISKILLNEIPPTLLAALLYLGAGGGMLIFSIFRRLGKKGNKEEKLTKKELPYTLAMIVLDIAAPILLMIGLSVTAAENVSLLNNFEIAATAIIALAVFKEPISGRLWAAIIFITISVIILSFKDISSFSFSFGSLFVLAACVCWGFENNCTRKLSNKDPLQIVVVKGLFSGAGSLIISLILNNRSYNIWYILAALILGFFAYGLSIYLYVYSQRELGAARTSAFYAVTPFIGAALSLVIFQDMPDLSFFIALAIMVFGAYLASNDRRIFGKYKLKQKK